MRKVGFKKSLVRNSEQTVPKVKEINVAEKIKHDHKVESNKRLPVHCALDKPELQSTRKLTKIIDDVTKLTKAKGITENEKLAVDEKVTRKVNFPYDQPIYKDLIPLEINHCKSSTVISSREPLPQKDKEPVLSDFLESESIPKYYCYPLIKVENRSNTITSNNLRLYHITEKQ